MTALLLAGLAVGGFLLFKRKPTVAKKSPKKSAKKSADDLKKLLPSTQLPEKPSLPIPPPVEPLEADLELVRAPEPCGGAVEELFEDVNWTSASGRPRYYGDIRWSPFVEAYLGLKALRETGDDLQQVWIASHNAAVEAGMCKTPLMLQNDVVATGKDVAYFSGMFNTGVIAEHRADPLSPTGVAIHWRNYHYSDLPSAAPYASGTAYTEDDAIDASEQAALTNWKIIQEFS